MDKMKVGKYSLGILTVMLLATGVFTVINTDSGVKVTISKTSTTFYVNESGKFVISGVEYGYLYNGSTKLSAVNVTTAAFREFNRTIFSRTTNYKNGLYVVDTYVFDGDNTDVRLFPVSHQINIINGEGLRYDYVVKKLSYSGPKQIGLIPPLRFGKNMIVMWSEGWYYAVLTSTLTSGGTLTVRYKVPSQDYTVNARLFDPPTTEYTCDFSVDSCGFSSTGAVVNTTQKYYSATAIDTYMYSSWQRTCSQCNVSFMLYTSDFTSGGDTKFFFATTNGTGTNQYYLIRSHNATHLSLMPVPGYAFEVGYMPINTWMRVVITMNDASGLANIYTYDQSGTLYNSFVFGSRTALSYTTSAKFFSILTGPWASNYYITNFTITDLVGGVSSPAIGINYTLNSPANGSNLGARSWGLINITVYNLNAS
jgi:hypothetical protein